MAKKNNVTLYIFNRNMTTNRIEREEIEAWQTKLYIKWTSKAGYAVAKEKSRLDRVMGNGFCIYSLDGDMLRAVRMFEEFNDREIQATLDGIDRYRRALDREHKFSSDLWNQEKELITADYDSLIADLT